MLRRTGGMERMYNSKLILNKRDRDPRSSFVLTSSGGGY